MEYQVSSGDDVRPKLYSQRENDLVWRMTPVPEKFQVYREIITDVLSPLPPNWTIYMVSLPPDTCKDNCFARITEVSGEMPADANETTVFRGSTWVKLSATSRAGLPLHPSQYRKGTEKASGNAWSPLGPAWQSRVSGSRPFPRERPTPPVLARGGEHPRPRHSHS